MGAEWRISFEIYCVREKMCPLHLVLVSLLSGVGLALGGNVGGTRTQHPEGQLGGLGAVGEPSRVDRGGGKGRGQAWVQVTGQAEEGASRGQAPREAGTPWQKQRASDKPPTKETPEEGLASSWVGFPHVHFLDH